MRLLALLLVLALAETCVGSAQRKPSASKPRHRAVSLKHLDEDSHGYGRSVRIQNLVLEECVRSEGDWATVLHLSEPASGTRAGSPGSHFAAIADESLARPLLKYRKYWHHRATLFLELGDWGFSPQPYSGLVWRIDFVDERGLTVLSLEGNTGGP